jgi:hypothetical protein
MQIKMKTNVVGPGIFFARNQVYDVPDARADELIAAHFATQENSASPTEKREKAVRKSLETR